MDVDAMMMQQKEMNGCPTVGYQTASICVPVTVIPFAKTGPVVVRCCREPEVITGKDNCCGVKNGICKFTISQKVSVAVPVEFGAEVSVGEAFVDCMEAEAEGGHCEECCHEECYRRD